MIRNKTSYLIIIISILFFSSVFGDTKTVNVKCKDKGTTLKVLQVGDVCFVSARELSKKLDWNIVINKEFKKAVLYPEGKRVKVSGENPYMMIEENVYQLPVEVKYLGGELFIPLNYFIENINNQLFGKYIFDNDKLLLEIEPEDYNIHGISIEEKKNGTLIRINTSREFKNLSNWVLSSGWFYLDIFNGRIDTSDKANYPKSSKGSNISKIIITQTADFAQISFKLRNKIENHIITQDKKNNEIQISLTKKLSDKEKPSVNISKILKEKKKNWEIDTIVLDAGHGGRDPGTRGISGTLEKNVNLDIVKRLGSLIERNLKINVKYTRITDKFIPLQERTKFANKVNGKLFISIHANSTPKRTTRAKGIEVYFLSTAKDKSSIEVAKRENRVVEKYEDIKKYENFFKSSDMLFAMMQSGFMKESEELAAVLVDNTVKKVRMTKRGVKQAGLWVLVGASMPCVLVEVGYLNNKVEDRNLRKKSYRQNVAEGLYEGIREFVKNSRREIAEVN